MKKIYQRSSVAALVVAALLLVGGASVQAQSTSTDSSAIEQLQQQVQQLQERVQQLREQIRSRVNPRSSVSEDDASTSSPSDVFADKRMKMGDRGENVRQLQELLAQDSDIYPEGLATGYYGQLTAQAVARLQQRINVPDTGEMNEETIQRVRELIENGAGNSGMTPPGLLHAPGIQRFFSDDDATTTDPEDDDDDSEASNHRRGPDIENLSIPEEIKERLRAIFDRFGDDKEDDDEDDDGDELEIEAEAEDGETKVEVEYADGSEEEFTFDTTDRSEVITRLAEETDLTEEEIEEVLEFETDDEDEDEDDDDDDEEDDSDDDEDEE